MRSEIPYNSGLAGVTLLRELTTCGIETFSDAFIQGGDFITVNDPSLLLDSAVLPEKSKLFAGCQAIFTTRAAPIRVGTTAESVVIDANTLLRMTDIRGAELVVESAPHGVAKGSFVNVEDAICASEFGVTENVTLTKGANLRWAPSKTALLAETLDKDQAARVLKVDSSRSWFLVEGAHKGRLWTNKVNVKVRP